MNEREIFIAALHKPNGTARSAFLDEACQGDGDLRGRVEDLLREHDQLGSFLEPPAQEPVATIDPPVTERLGTIIGPYKLLQQIGEGGMGVVWMAEQTHPVQRKVALKVIKAGMDSRQVVARFEAERQALAMMDHVNIARVFDGGATENGRPYFVMELVNGVPITKYCDDNHLTPRERLELFVPVCQAIQHAHQKGIIHRDIKPSNVMVTLYDGKPVPKVIDFGVAKATEQKLTERTLFTQYGTMVGTLEYMSPEQAEISALGVDTRSDIYSLGVLLYELLTGTTPLTHKRVKEAAYAEILRMIKEEEPSKPSTRLSDSGEALASISALRKTEPAKLTKLVRGELDWIVMKTLEKDRNRRYETAKDFAADVQRYLSDEPVQACPPSAGYRLRKLVRRNKVAVGTVSLVGFLLILGTVVSTWLMVRASNAEWLAENRLIGEKTERERAVLAVRDGKLRLFDSRLAGARAGRWSRRPGQRRDGLKALEEATGLARELGLDESVFRELRDEYVACLAVPDVRHVSRLPYQPEPMDYPRFSPDLQAFSPDLEHYAKSSERADIEVCRVADSQRLVRIPRTGANASQFSPSGRMLVSWPGTDYNRSYFRVWDWRGERLLFKFPKEITDVVAFAFSADDRRFAMARQTGEVIVYETAGWTETNRLATGTFAWNQSLSLDPTGTRLTIYSNTAKKLRVWDVKSGKVLHDLLVLEVRDVAWNRTGTLFAACGDDIHVWETASGRTLSFLQGRYALTFKVCFTLEGFLVGSTLGETTRIWDPWTGRELLQLPDSLISMNADGRRFLMGGTGGYNVWELEPTRDYWTLRGPATRGEGFDKTDRSEGRQQTDFSPDGAWLAACWGPQTKTRLWDLNRQVEVATLPAAIDLKFHPKGQGLFTSHGTGLYHWPLTTRGDTLRIGPAVNRLSESVSGISLDREGRRLSVGCQIGAKVLDLTDPVVPPLELAHKNSERTVLASPDGRWVVTGSQGQGLWDLQTGKLARTFNPSKQGIVKAFSPDGHWLLTHTISDSELRFWHLEAGEVWQPVRSVRMPRAVAFSPDGTVLAMSSGISAVELYEVGTWRPLVRLEGPDGNPIKTLRFGPGGTPLVLEVGERTVHVWDLRRIREQLREVGLDWSSSPISAPTPNRRGPIRVEVDLTNFSAVP